MHDEEDDGAVGAGPGPGPRLRPEELRLRKILWPLHLSSGGTEKLWRGRERSGEGEEGEDDCRRCVVV